MKTVAIIPARAGRNRIPRKNIKPFLGKPIIGYSIEAALQSGLFDKVIVSTDDVEITTVAKDCGAEVPFVRPAELSEDFSGTGSVVKHCLEWLKKQGFQPEFACCIYATAPFVQVRFLKEGLHRLVEAPDKAYAFSVTSFPFPIQRAIRINREGNVEAFHPEMVPVRSQDLEEAYHDAGQFYWGRTEAFLNDETIFSPSSLPIILPRYLVQDIDTQEDWKRAELMFAALKGGTV